MRETDFAVSLLSAFFLSKHQSFRPKKKKKKRNYISRARIHVARSMFRAALILLVLDNTEAAFVRRVIPEGEYNRGTRYRAKLLFSRTQYAVKKYIYIKKSFK